MHKKTKKQKKKKQKIGSQLLFLSKEEAQPEIRSQIYLSHFSNESSRLIGKSYPESWGLIFESVRAHAKMITITASVGFNPAGMESGIRVDKGAISRIIDAQLTRSKGLISYEYRGYTIRSRT